MSPEHLTGMVPNLSNSGEVITYKDALLFSMRQALLTRPDTVILGQGVDDHKGTFGSTKNLSLEFGPDRVMDGPPRLLRLRVLQRRFYPFP